MKKGVLFFILYLILIIWVIIQLYPVIIMFANGLKTDAQLAQNPWGFLNKFRFENWVETWNGSQIGTEASLGGYFLNSSIISLSTITLISIIAVYSSFAFAFYKFPGKRFVYGIIIAALAVPVQSLLIPIYNMLGQVGLRNNYIGIIGVYTTFWLPFTVIILTANLKSIPIEIIEAARIDGCSEFRLIWRIIIPLAKGAIASLAIINIIGIWSELLYAFILMNQSGSRTLTVGILAFKGEFVVLWSHLFAGLSIASLPILVFYLVFQRQISKAMTLGAIK